MHSEKICLASKTIEISEHDNYMELTNRLCYYDDKNLNNVMLPYKGVEEDAKRMAATLINMPLQAKYKKVKGLDDLGGHELSISKDGSVNWGTASIGTHTAAWISDPEDVITVSGEHKKLPCLYATARVWKRNANVISAIKRLYYSDNGLNSSWEISTNEYEYYHGVKKLTNYEFLGNTCLGSQITPAYSGVSKTIAMSSEILDSELMIAEALTLDLGQDSDAFDIDKNEYKEDDILDKDNIIMSSETIQNVEKSEKISETEITNGKVTVSVEEIDNSENNISVVQEEYSESKIEQINENSTETDVSALTERDLRRRIDAACNKKIGENSWCYITFWFPEDKVVWCEYSHRKSQLDFMKFTYEVEGDDVVVSDGEKVTLDVKPTEVNSTIAALHKEIETVKAELDIKNDAITKASETIQDLNVQISELTPFKEQVEIAEQKRIEAEIDEDKERLKSKMLKGNLFTEAEIQEPNIAELIEARNESVINSLIADKFVASFDIQKNEETTVAEVTLEETVATASLESDEDDTDVRSFMGKILF